MKRKINKRFLKHLWFKNKNKNLPKSDIKDHFICIKHSIKIYLKDILYVSRSVLIHVCVRRLIMFLNSALKKVSRPLLRKEHPDRVTISQFICWQVTLSLVTVAKWEGHFHAEQTHINLNWETLHWNTIRTKGQIKYSESQLSEVISILKENVTRENGRK